MRDIELTSATDLAYTRPAPGGMPLVVTATDPSFTDVKAYKKPSLGGEFGPVHSLLLSAPADGGKALLDAVSTITVTAPIVPTPPVVWPGRASNNSSFLNLYPWKKTPPQGLDQNNPNPPPALLVAEAEATPTLEYNLNGMESDEPPKSKQKRK